MLKKQEDRNASIVKQEDKRISPAVINKYDERNNISSFMNR